MIHRVFECRQSEAQQQVAVLVEMFRRSLQQGAKVFLWFFPMPGE
jgi:hypothetical protein